MPSDDFSNDDSVDKIKSTKNRLPRIKEITTYEQKRKYRASIHSRDELNERINESTSLPEIFDLKKIEELKLKQEECRHAIRYARQKSKDSELSDKTSSDSSISSECSNESFLPNIKKR